MRGKNVLDFFITNNDSLIKSQVIPGISDHYAVCVEGNTYQSNNQQTKLQDGSFVQKSRLGCLKQHMSKYVDSIMHSTSCYLSINDLWSSFLEEMTFDIKRFILHRFTSSR